MASTRNKYYRENYLEEKRQILAKEKSTFLSSKIYETHRQNPVLAGTGLIQGQIPKQFFARNSIDIESDLRGVWSLDVENPKAPPRTKINKDFKYMDMFNSSSIANVQPDPFRFDPTNRPQRL